MSPETRPDDAEQGEPEHPRPAHGDAVESEEAVAVDDGRGGKLADEEDRNRGGRPEPWSGEGDRKHDEGAHQASEPEPKGLMDGVRVACELRFDSGKGGGVTRVGKPPVLG